MAVVLAGVNSADVLGSERMLGIKARDGNGGLKGQRDSKCQACEIRTAKLVSSGAPNVRCPPWSQSFTSPSLPITKSNISSPKEKDGDIRTLRLKQPGVNYRCAGHTVVGEGHGEHELTEHPERQH